MNIESNIITNVLKLLNDIDITDKICNDELNYIKSFLSKSLISVIFVIIGVTSLSNVCI